MKLLSKLTKLKLDHNKKYLLACSGGPDSVALFHMMYVQNYNFEVAFVNYKTRNESDAEEMLIRKICKNCGVFANILVKKIENHGNFEDEARKVRYNFFKKIITEKSDIDGVVVAHHADDVIETYYLQRERRNYPTFYGLVDVSYQNGLKIYRPLLGYEKQKLLKYCIKNNLEFSIDITNSDVKYRRNLIRKENVESLSFEEKRDVINLINYLNKRRKKGYKFFDKFISENIADVNGLLKALAKRNAKNIEVLQGFCFYFVKKQGNFNLNSNFKNIIDVIYKGNLNKLFDQDNFYLIYDEIGLSFFKNDPRLINYCFSKEEFNEIGECNFEEPVTIKPLFLFEKFKMANGVIKKTNRFFIDCKIPLSLRYIWPCVLIDNKTIIYVPRYRKNYKEKSDSKLKFSTKTLQNLTIF